MKTIRIHDFYADGSVNIETSETGIKKVKLDRLIDSDKLSELIIQKVKEK